MPQLDFDGANSKVSADKIQGQSGTTVTVPTGHKIVGTDVNSITVNGVNAVAVAPSTSGNVLTSTGSAWASSAAAAGGAWTFLNTQTVSGSPTSVAITSDINSTYDVYKIVLTKCVTAGRNNIQMHFSDNGGSSYKEGGSLYSYYKGSATNRSNPSTSADSYNGINQVGDIELIPQTHISSSPTTSHFMGEILLFSPSDAAGVTAININLLQSSPDAYDGMNSRIFVQDGWATYDHPAVINAVRFKEGVNAAWTDGTIKLYGLSKS